MDADSFFLSFPEIRKATGLCYDVQGHSNKNQLFLIEEYIKDKPEYLKYLTNPSICDNGLKLIFRSDCMANLLLWYLMGATEGVRNEAVRYEERFSPCSAAGTRVHRRQAPLSCRMPRMRNT